jgi:hypothetical protein
VVHELDDADLDVLEQLRVVRLVQRGSVCVVWCCAVVRGAAWRGVWCGVVWCVLLQHMWMASQCAAPHTTA